MDRGREKSVSLLNLPCASRRTQRKRGAVTHTTEDGRRDRGDQTTDLAEDAEEDEEHAAEEADLAVGDAGKGDTCDALRAVCV